MGRTDAFSIAVLAEGMVILSLLPGAFLYWFPSPAPLAGRPRERLP
jgi:hypothetical protein